MATVQELVIGVVRELVMGIFLVVVMVLVRGLMVQVLGWAMDVFQSMAWALVIVGYCIYNYFNLD